MENTIWLEHKDYHGYLFSPEGNCLSLRGPKPRLLKNQIKRNGYVHWHLSFDEKKAKSVSAHRIIADIFCKKPDIDGVLETNHQDGDKANNHYSNLNWMTKSQNQLHSIHTLKKYNGFKRGSAHCNAKLKESEVVKIKKLLKNGLSYTEIAKIFNVSRASIGLINNNKNWKHIQ